MKTYFFKTQRQPKGFVILFVVLIAAIILLIGAGVFTISVKQNILSSTAKESQMAFSAADSGVECALYYDSLLQFNPPTPVASIDCADNTPSISVNSSSPGVFEFDLSMAPVIGVGGDNLPCAHVLVDKFYVDNAIEYTYILSRGYNTCDGNGEPILTNPLLLERVLEVRYPNPVATSITTGSSIGTGSGASVPSTSAVPASATPAASTSTSTAATASASRAETPDSGSAIIR